VAVKNLTRKRSRLSQVFAGILVNSVYEMQNYPVVLLNTVVSPLSILLVIVFVSRGSLFGVGIEGGFIMAMFSAGMGLSSDLSHLKNDFKLQDMIVSSPTSWLTYMIGVSLSEIVYAIPALIVLTILAYFGLSLTPMGVLEFVAVLLLIFIASISIGYTLSTFSSDIVQSFAFTRLISTVFSTIPPVYYPITYIPLPFRYLAYLSPTTYAAELVQGIGGYLSLSLTTVIIDWTVLVAVTIALFVLAKTKARWREV
jgi:ABC-2 type transport system permease protein